MDKPIQVHCLQHVPFEGAAHIETWARSRGHNLSSTRMYLDESLPLPEQIDLLVLLGGLMNVYEYDNYPWLLRERQFIKDCMDQQKAILGVCLGAQLIADVLGASVRRNKNREIGWFPVTLSPRVPKSSLLQECPLRFTAFHWHGDTFACPARARRLAKSKACANQAFQYGSKVLGLQFHLEYSTESIRKMLRNCSHELVPGPYVQSPQQMLSRLRHVRTTQRLLESVLDRMVARVDIPADE